MTYRYYPSTNSPHALLVSGKIEEALETMQRDYRDAVLYLSQFRSAKREHLEGKIDYQEFEKIQNRIIAAALDLLKH